MDNNGYLTLGEAAKIMRVSTAWLYRKCKAGIVPHIRIGGMIRFTRKDIDTWINSQKVKGSPAGKVGK